MGVTLTHSATPFVGYCTCLFVLVIRQTEEVNALCLLNGISLAISLSMMLETLQSLVQ